MYKNITKLFKMIYQNVLMSSLIISNLSYIKFHPENNQYSSALLVIKFCADCAL